MGRTDRRDTSRRGNQLKKTGWKSSNGPQIMAPYQWGVRKLGIRVATKNNSAVLRTWKPTSVPRTIQSDHACAPIVSSATNIFFECGCECSPHRHTHFHHNPAWQVLNQPFQEFQENDTAAQSSLTLDCFGFAHHDFNQIVQATIKHPSNCPRHQWAEGRPWPVNTTGRNNDGTRGRPASWKQFSVDHVLHHL